MQQLPFLRRTYQIESLAAPPIRTTLALLPHRNALRQPARHTVVGHLQSDDVHELVPDDLLPVGRQGIGRNQRDYLAEANANEGTDIGKTDRPHGKVFGILENLDQNRALWFEVILRSQGIPALFQQWLHIGPQDVGIALTHLYLEVLTLENAVGIECIEHSEHV